MNQGGAGRATADATVRDLLSSLAALQALSMVMTDNRPEDEILDLAVGALPRLTRQCRVEAVWLDDAWRVVDCLREQVGPGTDLEARIAELGGGGGALQWPGVGWAWAFPLSSRGGASGYLVVGSPERPAEHERSLVQGLAQETGMALANARLLARERAMRSRIVDEQATLRRLGTLAAEAAPPDEVFAAVAAEAGRLLEADFAAMSRYDPDGTATVLGAWARAGGDGPLRPGTRMEPRGGTTHNLVFETGRPVRIDDYSDDSPRARIVRQWGIRSLVAVPIHLERRLWGVIGVGSRSEEPLPPDTEEWLAGFTELVATAVANAQARMELSGFADEQAALRRVATLVARAASPDEVFAAVTAEVGRMLEADFTVLGRLDSDGAATVLGAWTPTDPTRPAPIGLRLSSGGHNVHTLVFQTGRPARMDDDRGAPGRASDVGRTWAFRSAIGAPISVEDRLWGVITVGSRDEPLPAGAERRLAGFSELVGTALANAEAQAALRASRARIVAAADIARRRIERDLHDGAQQHLVSLALQLRAAQAAVPPDARQLATQLRGVADGLATALEDLRDLARGIHPAALARGGLLPAVKTLAGRSAVPVHLDVRLDGRLPEPIEVAAYHVAAEALANAAKHSGAAVIDIEMAVDAGGLQLCISDDGRGGADLTAGSGLVGLTDRVEALGGRLSLHSPTGAGTRLAVTLPLDGAGWAGAG
ncbi:MAG TPA: GAF domain-containing protein [Acidimicrobiia bacterium]